MRIPIVATLALLLAGNACKSQLPDLKKPKNYSVAGFEFSYPGNWALEKEGGESNADVVKITSGNDQLFYILIFKDERTTSLDALVQDFVAESSKAMPIGDISKSSLQKKTKQGGYETQTEKFAATLIGVEVKMTRQYWRRMSAGNLIFMIAQAPDAAWKHAQPGFQLIADTFKAKDRQ